MLLPPVGPYLVTKDEVDLTKARNHYQRNGNIVQKPN